MRLLFKPAAGTRASPSSERSIFTPFGRGPMIGSRSLRSLVSAVVVAAVCGVGVAAESSAPVGRSTSIVVLDGSSEPALRQHGGTVWGRGDGLVIAEAGPETLEALAAEGLAPVASVLDRGGWLYLLSFRPGWTPPAPPA